MTPTQRVMLSVGMMVFSLMGLMPPWVHVHSDDPPARVSAGYAFVTLGVPIQPDGPNGSDAPGGPRRRGRFRPSYRDAPLESWSSEIDARRLALQWGVVAVVTGGIIRLIGAPRVGRRPQEQAGTRSHPQ